VGRVSAAPQPWSQEEILAAAVASLTEADIPPDEDDPDGWADPDADSGPPAELAGLTGAEPEELLADVPARPAPPAWPLSYQSPDGPDGQPWPAGFLPRDGSGHGAGFACDTDHTRSYDEDGWTLRVQSGPAVPPSSSAQTLPRLDPRTAQPRRYGLAYSRRAPVHHPAQPAPHLRP
jgi:hypothetical protein